MYNILQDIVLGDDMDAQLKKMPLVSYEKAYQYLISLDYTDAENILYLEQQLYILLQQNPEDTNLLVLLLHEQIMNNKGQRARSIAYKIWENGGNIAPELEKLYIDDLINLYLLDMAGVALMPMISDMENNINKWFDTLLNYSLISGNMPLLERTLNYLPDKRSFNILRDWCMLSEYMKVTEYMPDIMKRICKVVQDTMLSFSYNLFADREFPEIEFIFYVSDEVKDRENMRETLNLQISSYCSARKIDDLINLSSVVYPISRHPRLDV